MAVLASGLLALTTPARSEEAASARNISLADARQIAFQLGPDVLLAIRREAIARAQVELAAARGNPTLTVESSRLTARLITGASVPLPLFGQRGTAVTAAASDAQATTLDTEALRLEARSDATRAWLDLWEAQERAGLLDAAATETARVAAIANERFKAGSAPRLDTVRANADRARAQADAGASRFAVTAAGARLAGALGGDVAGPLHAEGQPDLRELPHDRRPLDELQPLHPALARDRAQAVAADAHIRAEQRQRWPVVTGQVTVNQFDPTTPGTDVVAGLSFEAPVFSLRGGAIKRARAEKALAEAVTDNEARRLRAELASAYEQARGASIRAEAFRSEVVPALEEARRMTEEGYRDGRVDLLRLLEAQRALLDGRGAYLDAKATAERALGDVERALGAPLPQETPQASGDAARGR